MEPIAETVGGTVEVVTRTICESCGKKMETRHTVPEFFAKCLPAGGLTIRICPECLEKKKREEDIRDSQIYFKDRLKNFGIPSEFVDVDYIRSDRNLPVREFLFQNHGKSILLKGRNDVGKSRALANCAAWLFRKTPEIRICWLNGNEFIDKYMSMAGNNLLIAEDYLKSIFRADLIIFDDVGKREINAARGDLLYKVFNRFYENRKRVWMTINGELSKFAARFEIRQTGIDVISRISRRIDSGEMVTMEVQ